MATEKVCKRRDRHAVTGRRRASVGHAETSLPTRWGAGGGEPAPSEVPQVFEPERYFRWTDIKGRVPIPRSTWYQRVSEGVIPPGDRLSPHIVAWRGEVLNEALARMAAHYAGIRFGPTPGARQRRQAARMEVHAQP